MKLTKYPDNTSYVSDTKIGTRVFRLNSYEDIWHLKQYVDAYCNQHSELNYKQKPNIVIPSLIDAQADRRFNEGESFGLKLVLQELVRMDANFAIFHPHNAEVTEMAFEMFNKKVDILDNSKFIKKIVNSGVSYKSSRKVVRTGALIDSSNLILMSSDAGGFKPLMKLADKIGWRGETESASKSRKYEDGKSNLIQKIDRQDFEGKDILIIDDICVYGGTFKGLAKMLRERNCGKLYLAVSHITVQNHKGKDDVFKYFDKVFTTNSKFDEYYVEGHSGEPVVPNNLEVLKLF